MTDEWMNRACRTRWWWWRNHSNSLSCQLHDTATRRDAPTRKWRHQSLRHVIRHMNTLYKYAGFDSSCKPLL